MAQPKKRTADSQTKTGQYSVSEALVTVPPVTLAAHYGASLGDMPAQTSPALTLQAWLEADVLLQSNNDEVHRWPRIYGLTLALGFSLCAWYAFGAMIGAILN